MNIDFKFITAIAHALKHSNTYEEAKWFAQSLTESKIESKVWIYNEVVKVLNPCKILILGSWFPTLLPYLFYNPKSTFVCVDIDPSLKSMSELFNNYLYDSNPIRHVVADVREFLCSVDTSSFDLVINTSCEHMEFDMKDFELSSKPLYVFQSNDYKIPEHINYKNNLEEFFVSTGLNDVCFQGTKQMNKFNRFMVIGRYNE